MGGPLAEPHLHHPQREMMPVIVFNSTEPDARVSGFTDMAEANFPVRNRPMCRPMIYQEENAATARRLFCA